MFVRINANAAGRAPGPAVREFAPVINGAVGIGLRVRFVRCAEEGQERDERSCEKQNETDANRQARHRSTSPPVFRSVRSCLISTVHVASLNNRRQYIPSFCSDDVFYYGLRNR